jgi:hypothetical protein
MMFQALQQLQEIYDASCKTKANKIMIERATFQQIATTFQQAYEQIKTKASTPTTAPENTSILDTLQQIKPASPISKLCKQSETYQAPVSQ